MTSMDDHDFTIAWNDFKKSYSYLAERFSIAEPTKEFHLLDLNRDELGMCHLRLLQIFHDLPLFNQQIIVHIAKDDQVRDITGEYCANLADLDLTPTFDSARAIEIAQQAFQQELEQGSTRKSHAQLGIYPKAEETYLAFAVFLPVWRDNRPMGLRGFIDAHTGDILDHDYQLNISGNTITESPLVQQLNRRLADK